MKYQVGHCDPKDRVGDECSPIIRQEHIQQTNGAQEIQRDKVFFFKTFPRHSAKRTFTIAIFGDMGLKKPEEQGVFEDQEGTMWKHADQILNLPDTLAPHAMESLMSLVHSGHNDQHPIRKSHLNERSSGLQMTNVQLVLHIGDIAYDMHEYRMKQKLRREDEDEVYNLGDRFMQVVEDIAAFVPYMVVAGNHENEEKTADYHHHHKGAREKGSSEKYEAQYEHYESRFQMPRNFAGHNTSQYYDFTYGPIWFICVSTEYYYSYAVKTPTFHWVPDWDNVVRQYEFIENSLEKANQNRHKYLWIIALQHRPFYCTSISKVTCRFNKMHKHGIPSKDNPNKLVYGLEELFNKHNVDLVITGHEHTFELFPPIELVDGKTKVVPDKFWWNVHRNAQHADEDNQELVDTRHEFKTFTDPVAPIYLIVGRPGNAEEMEKLYPVPWLQRLKYYNRFSFTLLHFPVGITQTKSTLAIRQVDIENGDVPMEFFVEKTFANYEPKVICAELDEIGSGKGSEQRMELSELTRERVQQRRNQFTKRRGKGMGKRPSQPQQAEREKGGESGETVGPMAEEGVPSTKGLIRELLYAMNGMEYDGERDADERRERIKSLKQQICENKKRKKDRRTETTPNGEGKASNKLQAKVIEREVNKAEKGMKPIECQKKAIGKEMIKQMEMEPIQIGTTNRRRGAWKSATDEESSGSNLTDESDSSAISNSLNSDGDER